MNSNRQMRILVRTMLCIVMLSVSNTIACANTNLAVGKPYKYEFKPVKKGRDGKDFSLDPGNRKLTNRALPRSWTMKAGNVLTKGRITLDLGKSQPVRTVMVYCASYPGIGIKYPRKIEVNTPQPPTGRSKRLVQPPTICRTGATRLPGG